MRARERAKAFWKALVDELEDSGETHAAFCARKGVNTRTLEGWRYRIRKERRTSPPASFVPVVIEQPRPRAMEMPVEIDLQGRITLRFGSGTEAAYVGALVGEVSRRC